jgi:hypothetical protein
MAFSDGCRVGNPATATRIGGVAEKVDAGERRALPPLTSSLPMGVERARGLDMKEVGHEAARDKPIYGSGQRF